MPLISSERPRPPSEQLVDLHVYVVPTSAWNEQYRSLFNQAVNETVSAGFVRAHPEDPLYKLRHDVEEQLGTDIIPDEYVFLRSVGRCFTQVKGKQEFNVKVKHFLPPYNFSAEIFVLKSRREPVPLPEINGDKEYSLERKYSRTEGTQTTQSTNSGYHSDEWPSNHVKPKSTETANQHLGAVKPSKKLPIGQPKKVPIRKGPKGISKKGAIALGSSMQQNGKISGKQFREMTNRRPEKKGLATARVIGKVGQNTGKMGPNTKAAENDKPMDRGENKIDKGKEQGVMSEGINRRLNDKGARLGVKRRSSEDSRSDRLASGIGRQPAIDSLEPSVNRQSVMPHTSQSHGYTAPHSSHQPSNQGDNNSSSPHDTYSSLSSSGQQPLPPIDRPIRHFLLTPPHSHSPIPLHLNSPSFKQTKSQQHDLTSGSQDSLPRFLSPEQNSHAFPKQEKDDQSPRSRAPTNNTEHRPPLSATPPDSPMFSNAYLTNQLEIAEHIKPGDKPGWRDTYTNGTNEDSGIAEPTPEEGDLEFHQQLRNSIERHEAIDQPSGNRQMIVVDHNQEEPHRTEQTRLYHNNDFVQSNENKTIQNFQKRYDKFLEDEENRKEIEDLEQMREHNAQNVADVRRKKEIMELTMARRVQELASQNSHGNQSYQIDDIAPFERSSLASKEVSEYGHITALSNNDPRHSLDEQRDFNQEQWSNGQALTERQLLHQFQKDEAEKNRRALEAIQIGDSNKEHSFLKKGHKRGVPSAIKKQQDTSLSVPTGKTPRPAQHTSQPIKNKDYNQLLADLEETREQRQAIEQRREELVRKAKTLQTRTVEKRNKARDYWKKQYFEAKKLTNPQEESINKLRQQVEQAHRKLMVMMEGRIQAKKMPPSQKNNHKINIAKGQHDLEDLRRRVENAKMRLTSEMKLRNQAEKELRTLKNELTQKKIHVTLTRSQQLAILKESEEGLLSSRTPQPYMTPLPRRTPVVTAQLRQSLTPHP